jgi:hypothetical protein
MGSSEISYWDNGDIKSIAGHTASLSKKYGVFQTLTYGIAAKTGYASSKCVVDRAISMRSQPASLIQYW